MRHSRPIFYEKVFRGPFLLGLLCVFILTAIVSARAQTFTVIHNFTGLDDGEQPAAGVTIDAAGNLYGTAWDGGHGYLQCQSGCGTVYTVRHTSGGWKFETIHLFLGGNDGAYPATTVVLGPDHELYGTTYAGGGQQCVNQACGTVFKLRPPPTACTTALCPWLETVLYRFQGGSDGSGPGYGSLRFDAAGSLYGTTIWGGGGTGFGTVYELTPSDGGWTENVIHRFTGSDGSGPESGVIFDQAGTLFGTTVDSGSQGGGTVFELSPTSAGWVENTLYSFDPFDPNGYFPIGGLLFDDAGNLYGTTSTEDEGRGGGTFFQLAPSGGTWTFNLLYSFAEASGYPAGPTGSLVMDAAGNLYGSTQYSGAYGHGAVFRLMPSPTGWTYTSLHDFTGGSDGGEPYGSVAFDASGNIYGTTTAGGTYNAGVIWQITP